MNTKIFILSILATAIVGSISLTNTFAQENTTSMSNENKQGEDIKLSATDFDNLLKDLNNTAATLDDEDKSKLNMIILDLLNTTGQHEKLAKFANYSLTTNNDADEESETSED